MRDTLVLVGTAVTVFVCFVVYAQGADDRALAAFEAAHQVEIRAGDLVLQQLDCGERCRLIRRVSAAPYDHVGVVAGSGDERVVWEAAGPVGSVPLARWLQRGVGRTMAVYRPPRALAHAEPRVLAAVRAMAGRPYDADYQWDDARIYCSELVAKAYLRALGRPVWVPRARVFGADAARIATLSNGRLTESTPLVTPADLAREGGFERVVDPWADASQP